MHGASGKTADIKFLSVFEDYSCTGLSAMLSLEIFREALVISILPSLLGFKRAISSKKATQEKVSRLSPHNSVLATKL